MLQIVASLTEDYRGVIYYCNIFITEATGLSLSLALMSQLILENFSALTLSFGSFLNLVLETPRVSVLVENHFGLCWKVHAYLKIEMKNDLKSKNVTLIWK